MTKIEINRDKCIGCGACVRDCITYSLKLGADSIANIEQESCISCQHCFAVCPTGAITIDNKTPQNASSTSYANPDEILSLIKSRRSIRQFKNEEISSDDFKKIKEMLPYIPTGCNFNSLHFSIIESKTAMDKIRNYVNTKVLKLISNRFTQKYAGKFAKFKTAFENGEDIIFRNAPHMIIVSSHIKAPCANIDPIIALSYIELYAQSIGLGTCWCGFAQACFKILPRLSNMADIPNNYKPVYVMLIGKPAVKYCRTTLPDSFPISEINDIETEPINIRQRLKRFLLNFIK